MACVYWKANLDDFVWTDKKDSVSNVDSFVVLVMQSYYNTDPTNDIGK